MESPTLGHLRALQTFSNPLVSRDWKFWNFCNFVHFLWKFLIDQKNNKCLFFFFFYFYIRLSSYSVCTDCCVSLFVQWDWLKRHMTLPQHESVFVAQDHNEGLAVTLNLCLTNGTVVSKIWGLPCNRVHWQREGEWFPWAAFSVLHLRLVCRVSYNSLGHIKVSRNSRARAEKFIISVVS